MIAGIVIRNALGSVLVLAAMALPGPSHAGCIDSPLVGKSPSATMVAKLRGLFAQRKFAELDAIEVTSRNLDERLEDGQTLRGALYEAIGNKVPFLRGKCTPIETADEEALRASREMAEVAAQWLKQSPGSRAARFLVPASKSNLAFAYRGTHYANEVPAAVWKEVGRNVNEAIKALDAMKPEEKRDPIWHLIRLDLLRLQGYDRKGVEKVVSQAIAAAPEVTSIYFRAAIQMSPLYGGSHEDIGRLAESTLKKPSKDGSHVLYTRVQWSQMSRDMFENGQADWSQMRKGFEQIVERYPHNWNVNNFGRFACAAKDKETTKRLVELTLKPPYTLWEEGWGSNIFFFRCRAWADGAGPWYKPEKYDLP